MQTRAQLRQRGFSLFELVAVVVVIAILALVLLKFGTDYAEEAEKTAMEQVLSSTRAALHLRVAGMIAHNQYDAIPRLAEQNPMDWMSDKPPIYAGTIYGVAPRELAPTRSWYYDSRAKELVYRAQRTRHLLMPRNAENEIRFKIYVEQGTLPGGEEFAKPLRGMRRAEIAAVEPYQWSISTP